MGKLVTCENYRRFGIEIELNTTSGIIREKTIVPDGAETVAAIIQDVCGDPVSLNGWHHVNNNEQWIIKPDSTCGIEINSPVLKGVYDLAKLCRIVQKLAEHPDIQSDDRCSFHVHVNLEDLDMDHIGTVLAWWVKCEGVFFDSVPASRKCHRHTQLIGMSDMFTASGRYDPGYMIDALSDVKYHSANVYHMRQKRRKSVEFRIAGNEFCLNPIFVKNWVRLLLHFVEVASKSPFPKKYTQGDSWSGLLWLNPKEVFSFLNFDKELSLGMKQVKQWFLDRLKCNGNQGSFGVFVPELRSHANLEVRKMANLEKDPIEGDTNTLLYSREYFI